MTNIGQAALRKNQKQEIEHTAAELPIPHRRPRSLELWKWLSLPMFAFLLLPLVALLLKSSPRQWLENLGSLQVQQAILLSLTTTGVSLGLTILLGTPAAYWLSHGNSALHRVMDTFIDLPIVLPPSVAGVALLMAFGRRGLAGGWLADIGIQIAFTPIAVILAQVFVASPYYIRSAAAGFARIDVELKQAAELDGANGWQVFRYIVFPLAGIALLSGGVMSWARALGEFGATMIFAGNFPGRTQTMPLAIYIGFELDLNVALTLSVILMTCSFFALMLVKGVLHKDWM